MLTTWKIQCIIKPIKSNGALEISPRRFFFFRDREIHIDFPSMGVRGADLHKKEFSLLLKIHTKDDAKV